jgi:hypothetical protein
MKGWMEARGDRGCHARQRARLRSGVQ